MLKAWIYRKLRKEQEDAEDILTATVFGTIEYIDSRDLLKSFLARAVNSSGVTLNVGDIAAVRFEYWRTLTFEGCNACQPDILVHLEHANGRHTIIAIEAKLNSGKSSLPDETPRPNDQLAKQWDNLIRLAQAEGCSSLALIYLTADAMLPRSDLEESLAEYRSKRNGEAGIYWLGWSALRDLIDSASDPILVDLRTVLDRCGLKSFERWSSLKWTERRRKVEWRSPLVAEYVGGHQIANPLAGAEISNALAAARDAFKQLAGFARLLDGLFREAGFNWFEPYLKSSGGQVVRIPDTLDNPEDWVPPYIYRILRHPTSVDRYVAYVILTGRYDAKAAPETPLLYLSTFLWRINASRANTRSEGKTAIAQELLRVLLRGTIPSDGEVHSVPARQSDKLLDVSVRCRPVTELELSTIRSWRDALRARDQRPAART